MVQRYENYIYPAFVGQPGSAAVSQQAFIGKTQVSFCAHDDMVQQFDIEEPGGFPDLISEFAVGLAGVEAS